MFTRSRVERLLKTAPGPSPWYLRTFGPRIQTACGEGKWVEIGSGTHAGGEILLRAGGNVLAIIPMYNWVSAIDPHTLLIWSQAGGTKGNTAPVHVAAVDCRRLVPLDDPRRGCMDTPPSGTPVITSGIIAEVDIPTVEIGCHQIDFPSPISSCGEILILAHSSGVDHSDGAIENICLVIVRPEHGTVELIPQDWFNKGPLDFGYQWITRVARDLKTGHIVGDGIRIGTFMLDKSCRNVRKWLRM